MKDAETKKFIHTFFVFSGKSAPDGNEYPHVRILRKKTNPQHQSSEYGGPDRPVPDLRDY
jgi:hypothetical protein